MRKPALQFGCQTFTWEMLGPKWTGGPDDLIRSIADAGYAGIEITDTAPFRNPYYHTPDDMPDRLNYDRLARFTWGMQAVVRELAGSV